ncbi:MAG: HAD family hydrolase, partial [Anaerolineae bacterium]|nr:HAD family hydrolase [Anaerolineae bacterium]
MLRALLFDLDETLIDWSQIHVNWADIIREPLRPVHAYLLEQGFAVPSLDDLCRQYRQISNHRWESAEPPEWFAPSATHNLRDALAESGLVLSEMTFAEVFQRFAWRPIPGIQPFTDTHTVMTTIRASGLKIGLITNMTIPMQKREVEMTAYNLSQYFDLCLSAADIGHMKPHPLPFRLALESLDVKAEEAIFIGDSPE